MKKVIILVVLLAVIGGIVWLVNGGNIDTTSTQAKYADPADAVGDFYDQWLKAAQDPSLTPDRSTLAKSPTLTKELSAKVAAALQTGGGVDPVLCQSVVPQGITTRNVYEQADKAEILVTSKDKSVTKQAVVSLTKSSDSWFISEIQCTDGDIAPVQEFSFEKEGFLIKQSVPKPFNNKNWHLVFTQDGKPGNVVPLIFDAKSQCTNLEGVKAVCKPEQFKETAQVRVRGGMTERGATVAHLEFVK